MQAREPDLLISIWKMSHAEQECTKSELIKHFQIPWLTFPLLRTSFKHVIGHSDLLSKKKVPFQKSICSRWKRILKMRVCHVSLMLCILSTNLNMCICVYTFTCMFVSAYENTQRHSHTSVSKLLIIYNARIKHVKS